MVKNECHYDVLGVPRDCDEGALKKAYRQQARKLHPDKNPGREEEATAEFQRVQAAYAVLSDPQERAWYDDHRESILRGGTGVGGQEEDEGLDLMPYFASSAFSGFGDDVSGFYHVYSEAFATLWADEQSYADEPEEDCPNFGDSWTPYEEVHKFYRYWSSFRTNRRFASADSWDTRGAPNRRVKRAMEKENNQARAAARKKYSSTVQELVSFVKRRDKRVIRHKTKQRVEKAVADREKEAAQKKERKRREESRRAAHESAEAVAARRQHEAEVAVLEQMVGDMYGEGSASGEEQEEGADEEAGSVYCAACEKAFKSQKAWENHQQSKKHKKVVAQLRRQLEADDVAAASAATGPDDVVADRASAGEDEMPWSDSEMFLDGDLERFSDDSLSGETSDGRPRGEGSGAESSEESGSDVDLSGLVGMRKRGNGARPETDGHINEGRGPAAASSEGQGRAGPVSPAAKSEEESEEESSDDPFERMMRGAMSKKKARRKQRREAQDAHRHSEEEEEVEEAEEAEEIDGQETEKEGREGGGGGDHAEGAMGGTAEQDATPKDKLGAAVGGERADEGGEDGVAAAAKASETTPGPATPGLADFLEAGPGQGGSQAAAPKKLKGKKAKEARRAAREAAGLSTAADTELMCRICNNRFASKTKLHKHIAETGHAVVQHAEPQRGGGRKKKSRARG